MAIQAGETTFYQAKRGIVQNGLVLNLDAGVDESYSGGTTWRDLEGGNNGTLTNGPVFDKEKGGFFLLDGTDDFVDLGANIVNPFPITMCVWFKTTTTFSSSSMIFAQANSTNANNYQILYFYTDAKLYWQVRGGSSTTAQSVSSTTLNDGVWRYAVGVSDSSSNHKLYIDGVLDGSSTTNVGSTSPDTLRIGCWKRNNGSESLFYNGDVGIAQMYNRALTATEVLQNYNATRHRFGV